MTAEPQAASELPFRLKDALENGVKVEEMDTAGPEPEKGVERGLHIIQVRSTKEVRMTQGPPGHCLELQATVNGKLARVKKELLDAETPSTDVPRQRFRQVCYQDTEGPREACRSLQGLCHQWLKPESNTKEQILELVILEQFLAILPPEMQSWVTDFSPGTCSQAVALAEDFQRRQRGGERQVLEPYKKVVVNFPEPETAPTGTSLAIKQESDWGGNLLGDWMGEKQKEPSNPGRPEQQRMLQGKAKKTIFDCLDQGGASEIQPRNHPEKEKFINSQGKYEELEEEPVPPRILQDERLKTCPDCGKGFVWRSQVIEHQRTHTGERPYACSYCGKSFSSKSYVIKHERIHTGEKPYKCSDCGRGFSRRDVLVAHQRTHTGEKPYKCMHCGQRFSARERLLVHERVHTGEKPYKCSVCERCFRDRSSFYAHKRSHKGEEPHMLNMLWEKV
ncbi:zinc finger and SCAN domain-containing protein 23-like [Tiliqua scincoides]|uniref:zinc finger and SCAN domain-containing protein 23-like n=1 Tax=Tiliqua scincoides TaxID=71010 RepID=UPI003461B5A6